MEFQRAYELMDIELECIRRNAEHRNCDRECEHCDLVQKDTDLIEAFQIAKFAIKKLYAGEWIQYVGKTLFTPGGDPVWVCGECGKGQHVYGIETIKNKKDRCPDCGRAMMYPWEKKHG